MAAVATVVAAYKDDTHAYLSVRVEVTGKEYQGRALLLDDQGAAKTLNQLKLELIAACKAQRDSELRPAIVTLAITGSVNL